MPTREIHGVSADTGAAHADAAHPAIARVKALIAQGITASGYARAAAVALLDKQDSAGYWCGDLTADSTLLSDYILLQMWRVAHSSLLLA